MIRRSALQRPLAHLALLAILMMALLPTLGRLAQSSPHAGDMPLMAMCTAAGMVSAPVALFDPSTRTPAAPERHLHPDCEYCPLLGMLVVTLLAIAIVLLRNASVAMRPLLQRSHSSHVHPCGLGSRGPPLAL